MRLFFPGIVARTAEEAARTHLLSDNLSERMALDRVASVIVKAQVQTA